MDAHEKRLRIVSNRLMGIRDRLRRVLPDETRTRYAWSLDASLGAVALVTQATSLDFGDETLTRKVPGLIGCSASSIELARQYNAAKVDLGDAVLDLRPLLGAHGARKQAVDWLREWIDPRLSLRQAYRLLPLIETPVCSIRFTWARAHRPIERITRIDAERLLEETFQDLEDREHAREILYGLPSHQPLYRVYPPGDPHLRANVRLASGRRHMIQAHSPILFPMETGTSPPDHNTEPRAQKPRSPRHDRRISDTPVIPHTPIHTVE